MLQFPCTANLFIPIAIMTCNTLGCSAKGLIMIIQNAFLWLASIPLGYVSGILLGLPIFITTIFLRIDDIIKSVWCIGRLNSGKWIHNVVDKKESEAEKQ